MSRSLGVLVLVLALAACSRGNTGDAVPDGNWELVRLEFRGEVFEEPLVLSSADQLMGGRGACNSFGQQDDGSITQTLVGCVGIAEQVDEALIDAITGHRTFDGNTLILEGSFARAELVEIVLPTVAEFFAVLASDEPDIDPATLLLDSEAGGPPQDWDRMLRLDDPLDFAEFVVGSSGGSVCFHVGLDTERVTSGSSCRAMQDVRSDAITMIVGYPTPKVAAALIPDGWLTAENLADLGELGTVQGNLFIANQDATVMLTLEDSNGAKYSLELPAVADLR